MAPRFANRTTPSLEQLTELQKDQHNRASPLLDGSEDDPTEGFGVDRFCDLEVWDVLDAQGVKRFEAWAHDGDSGFVFYAGTDELLGCVVNGGFSAEDVTGWRAVADAAEATDFKKSPAGAIAWELDDV